MIQLFFICPPVFKIDTPLQAKELYNECVYYKRDITYDEGSNIIKIISNLSLKKNIITPAEYKNVSELLNTIEKEEANKLVLKKG